VIYRGKNYGLQRPGLTFATLPLRSSHSSLFHHCPVLLLNPSLCHLSSLPIEVVLISGYRSSKNSLAFNGGLKEEDPFSLFFRIGGDEI
jgi:hypothetical protein